MSEVLASVVDPPNAESDYRNVLLSSVAAVAPEIMPATEKVDLRSGDALSKPGEELTHAYFPETAVISLITVMADGTSIEAAAIGNEGVLGASLALSGFPHTTRRAVAQVPGQAVRVPSDVLRAALIEHPDLHSMFLRYVEAMLFESMQSGGCIKLHSMPKRCARWLVMTHDRVGADTFRLTQQYLAFMLGVRRATVNTIAAALQRRGLIRYQRGRITILDRAGLEAEACECYDLIRNEYARQLVPPASPVWTPEDVS